MLERLEIRNFQKHRRLDLDLAHPVAVISGRTDAGKSSVIRALRWLCLNQPGGDEFVRRGARKVRVTLHVDDHVVTRGRGQGQNYYDLDGQRFVALGLGKVPEPIAALLNVTTVNFQGQLDSPFWLTASPGQVSRELNAVVNLDLIDTALANADRQVKRARTEQEVSQGRLDKAREERDALSWVPRMYTDFQQLDGIQTLWAQNGLKRARLGSLLVEVSGAVSRKKTFLGAFKAAETVLALGERAQTARERAEALRGLLDRAEELNGCIRQCDATQKAVEESMRVLVGETCPLCGQPTGSGRSSAGARPEPTRGG